MAKQHWRASLCGAIFVMAMCVTAVTRAQEQTAAASATNRTARDIAGRSFALVCPEQEYTLDAFESGEKSITSPDNQKTVVLAKDGALQVFNNNRQIGKIPLPDISADLSIVWSPDSAKLAVTYSDGGTTGGFHAHVYALSGSRLIELTKPVQVAFDDFKKEHYCEARGDNEYVLGWPEGSKSVFVVAEVYPTSDCGSDMGLERGYLMDLNGNILRKYSDAVTQRVANSCEKSGRAIVR